jgi:hypothetical protein
MPFKRSLVILMCSAIALVAGGVSLREHFVFNELPEAYTKISNDQQIVMSFAGILIPEGDELSHYSAFLRELEEVCPYYKPDGATYRQCLWELLEKRTEEGDLLAANLTDRIKIVIAEKDERDIPLATEEKFLSSFEELSQLWKPYRDAFCGAEHSTFENTSYDGSFMTVCRLHETAKQKERILRYKAENNIPLEK